MVKVSDLFLEMFDEYCKLFNSYPSLVHLNTHNYKQLMREIDNMKNPHKIAYHSLNTGERGIFLVMPQTFFSIIIKCIPSTNSDEIIMESPAWKQNKLKRKVNE
jgi:hypothetical protein